MITQNKNENFYERNSVQQAKKILYILIFDSMYKKSNRRIRR